MKCNPLITRFRYSTLRRSRFSIYMTVYGVTLTVLFFINYSLYRYAGAFADAESLFNALFVQLLTVQVLILVFLFIALYFMLPWVIGGIMGRDAVFGLSPVALPWFLGEGPPYETPLWLIGAYNIALSVPPAAIILNRYKSIVNAHV